LIQAVGWVGVPVPIIVHVPSPNDRLGRGFIATRMPSEALGVRIVDHPYFPAIRPHLAEAWGTIRDTPVDPIDTLETLLRSFGEPNPVFEVGLI
jgi:hypothetical protein